MRLPEEPDTPVFINITSLIDVTFSILAFFILSTLFLAQNLGLSVNLPKANNAKALKSIKVALTVDKAGKVALNKNAIAVEEIAPKIKEFVSKSQGNDVVVSLEADEDTRHGNVVAVMDKLRGIDGIKMAIRTRKLQQLQPK
ncbi:MAG: biopolymer transporter ExbD [Pseudanabaena sp. RU_4_16]|nr:biopolymer transporter ExbD [Pseudanabaena sp. RU_4_16]